MMRGAAGIEDPWMCSREHRVLISCLFESGSSSPSSWDQVRIAFDQIWNSPERTVSVWPDRCRRRCPHKSGRWTTLLDV